MVNIYMHKQKKSIIKRGKHQQELFLKVDIYLGEKSIYNVSKIRNHRLTLQKVSMQYFQTILLEQATAFIDGLDNVP